ncbi:MAG TPA: hypothetical protein VF820_06420 [Patescibacteria group bacterium]
MILLNKKTIITVAAVAALVFGSAAPALAQQQGQENGSGGFMNMFSQFFSHFFQRGQVNQGQGFGLQNQENNPMISGTPTGSPEQMEEARLQGLVTAGKITQAQATQITAEITKIESEITAWSQSTGINAAYVYGGLRGMGVGLGPNGENGPEVTGMPERPMQLQNGQQGGQSNEGFGPRGNR